METATLWITIIAAVVATWALYYAHRSAVISAESLSLQRNAEAASKRADLDLHQFDPQRTGSLLAFERSQLAPDQSAQVLITCRLANRGAAVADHIRMELRLGQITVPCLQRPTIAGFPNELPEAAQFIAPWSDFQQPPADPVQISVHYQDLAGRHTVRRCFQITYGQDRSFSEWSTQPVNCAIAYPASRP